MMERLKIYGWLSLCVMLTACSGSSHSDVVPLQPLQAVQLQIYPDRDAGVLPSVLRPSVMMSWADDAARQAFLNLPGRLATVRMTLEPCLTDSTDLASYKACLLTESTALKTVAAKTDVLVLTVARMPRWLSSSSDETALNVTGFTQREASPPANLQDFEQLGFATVQRLNVEQGLQPFYEFWNEPESSGFWVGTQAELFNAYAAFARGARRADPQAHVGGFGVGSWNGVIEKQPSGTAPLLENFIDAAVNTTNDLTPTIIDFISWHNFTLQAEEGWEGARMLRDYMSTQGMPVVPQIVTEWNVWHTFPEWLDPVRDEAEGAAYLVAGLNEMALQGVERQTIATLQDFQAPKAGRAFEGDFGLLTREPMLKKATFHAMNMLAHLGTRRVDIELPAIESDAIGMDAAATIVPGGLAILLSRNAVRDSVLLRSLHRSGIVSEADLQGISEVTVTAFVKGEIELTDSDGTPEVRAALTRAREAARLARDSAIDTAVDVHLAIADRPTVAAYQVYYIDASHLNPGHAYRRARANGASHAQALDAARAQEAFTPALEGSGELPVLQLAAHSVALIMIAQ